MLADRWSASLAGSRPSGRRSWGGRWPATRPPVALGSPLRRRRRAALGCRDRDSHRRPRRIPV